MHILATQQKFDKDIPVVFGNAEYKLKDGLLQSGASGGDEWNPLTSGATVMVLRQFNRYEEYETDEGNFDGTIHPLEFGLLWFFSF